MAGYEIKVSEALLSNLLGGSNSRWRIDKRARHPKGIFEKIETMKNTV